MTYFLAGNAEQVEILRLQGGANLAGVGNNIINTMFGNGGNNLLDGGLGSDTMTGGLGNDTFRFTSALGPANVDTITDFLAADDRFQIDNAVFVGLAAGALAATAFKDIGGGAAIDANDRIIYNSANGDLFFDQDGSGGAFAAVKFADLSNNAIINAADFVVI